MKIEDIIEIIKKSREEVEEMLKGEDIIKINLTEEN